MQDKFILFTFASELRTIIFQPPERAQKIKIMKTSEIINEIRNSKVGVMSIILKDASRYAANAEGEMVWAGTLFTKKYADRQDGDEVITTGNKETNLSEVKRVLTSLIGKGEVQVRLMNVNWLTGEIEPEDEPRFSNEDLMGAAVNMGGDPYVIEDEEQAAQVAESINNATSMRELYGEELVTAREQLDCPRAKKVYSFVDGSEFLVCLSEDWDYEEDLCDIADENGLEVVETTSERSGYPRNLKQVIRQR